MVSSVASSVSQEAEATPSHTKQQPGLPLGSGRCCSLCVLGHQTFVVDGKHFKSVYIHQSGVKRALFMRLCAFCDCPINVCEVPQYF